MNTINARTPNNLVVFSPLLRLCGYGEPGYEASTDSCYGGPDTSCGYTEPPTSPNVYWCGAPDGFEHCVEKLKERAIICMWTQEQQLYHMKLHLDGTAAEVFFHAA